ncbi:MAG TPA: SDR family oxidoreductase [Chitinophagaceae bacterium]|nr:SDR family oxidoreductase [Chitinophagaceae bacterium]
MDTNNAAGRVLNVMVTGASRGIGNAIADIFAANGHQLFLTSRNDIALYKAVEVLMAKHPAATIYARPFDLSEKDQAKQAGEWVLGLGIIPDILVNNAGTFEPGGVQNEPEGTLESQLATNLYSAYHLTRALLPAMIQQGSNPALARHIFNMCSIASLKAYHNGGAYSISKFALYGFSRNLREEMKPYGIKVTAVLPGAVMTDSWSGFDNRERRIMEAEDIAKMVFASSQLSLQACVEDILIRPQKGDL